jgi:hypothetical protein
MNGIKLFYIKDKTLPVYICNRYLSLRIALWQGNMPPSLQTLLIKTCVAVHITCLVSLNTQCDTAI